MSLSSTKQDIFTTIGAYTSLNQETILPDKTNLYPSVNNKKDIVPFLLDLLKTIVGTDALKQLTGQLFTDFIDGVEPQMKSALIKQLTQYNAGDILPTSFKNNGVTLPLKDIDIYSKFRTNPNSDAGNLLYDLSKDTFDKKVYDAIINSGTDIVFNNLLINYNDFSDLVTLKPNPASISPTTTIGDWLVNFVNGTVIINKKEFLTNVMNTIYGSISSVQEKTIEQTYQELQVSKLIEQLINDDDSFEILQSDFDSLLNKAEELVNGVIYYDMGCGVVGAILPLSGMTNLISTISGSTDSFAVSNAVNATIDESLTNTPEVAAENKEPIKDGFFQRLIQAITLALSQFITTAPQIRALLAIKSAFENNGIVQIGNPLDDLKKFKIFLKCIIQDVMRLINEFIYNLVVRNLITLLNPIIRKIITEKINQYIGIIKALIL